MRHLRTTLLLICHLAVASLCLAALVGSYQERHAEVERLRSQAVLERAATAGLERQVMIDEALRAGLQEGDPYVIELMARRKLGMRRDGEIVPPPLSED
jgi:cell division protein FtsB